MAARIETVVDQRITLSYAAFDVLYCGECGDDAPKPAGLEGLSPGATYGERIKVVTEVLASLRQRGLATVDSPAPSLLETVRLLHNPHRRVYGRYALRNEDTEIPGGFHIAESDDLAVLAQYENGDVTLEPVPWDKVYATAYEFPPPGEPVPGGEIVVPLDGSQQQPEYDWVPPGHDERPRAATQVDHHRIREYTDPSTLWFAMQVFTARKDALGREIVSEFPLHYYVGDHGAVMTVHKRPDAESEPMLHMIPATRTAFLDAIRAL